MKSPIILEGESFDWKAGQKAASHVINNNGSINWTAAMLADPGVMSCPSCGIHLWWEGKRVRCPDCGHEWNVK
jgi:uncharacterized Zn finger protein (UPF0148 family)